MQAHIRLNVLGRWRNIYEWMIQYPGLPIWHFIRVVLNFCKYIVDVHFFVSKAFTIKQKLAEGEKVRSHYYMLVWMCYSCKIPTNSLLYDKKDIQTFCNEDTVSSGWIFGQKHFRKHPVTFWHSKLWNKAWLIRYVWSKIH